MRVNGRACIQWEGHDPRVMLCARKGLRDALASLLDRREAGGGGGGRRGFAVEGAFKTPSGSRCGAL